MASFTLDTNYHFVSGDIGAYPASLWPGGIPSGAPVGAATNTQTISGGSVTFTGLTAGASYYATDATGTKYVRFTVPSTSLPDTTAGALAPATQTLVDGGFSIWTPVLSVATQMSTSAVTGTKYLVAASNPDVASGAAANANTIRVPLYFYHDSTLLPSSYYKMQYRVVMSIKTSTAPAITYTASLYSMTTTGSSVTANTQVSGSTVAIASPAQNTLNYAEGTAFDGPATGWYLPILELSGTPSGTASPQVVVQRRFVAA